MRVFEGFCHPERDQRGARASRAPPLGGFEGGKTLEKPSKKLRGRFLEGFSTIWGGAGRFFEGFPAALAKWSKRIF